MADSLEPDLQPPRVPTLWLPPFEDHVDARRLAALQADVDLLDHLMLTGYTGPLWRTFADRLARYGMAVIGAWCHNGQIFGHCAAKGWYLTPARLPAEDAENLAVDTVANAIVNFRDNVLIPRKWDPTEGATLSTYFIGQCLMQFPNFYRPWRQDRARRPIPIGDLGDRPDLELDPVRSVLSTETQLELLEAIGDPLTRQIVLLKAAGEPNSVIATRTGLGISAIKSRLHRLNQREPGVA